MLSMRTLRSLHEIHHMNRVIHRDGVRPGKCIADCVDKLAAVQSGALHFHSFLFFQCFLLADDIVVHPFGIAVPLIFFIPWSRWIGRGSPSMPRRPQSQSLKVKIYGVALISSTIVFFPEQCTVPAGIST